MDKKTLRAELSKKRLSLSEKDWRERSDRIVETLIQHPLLQKSDHIALYVSFRKEVDLLSLVRHFPLKHFYFPVTHFAELSMEFLRSDPSLFHQNSWGLLEPESGDRLDFSQDPLIIVPALAFDKNGYRLGYGKGFYDRYLQKQKFRTLGVCFSEFFLEDLPHESHDISVDAVITESFAYDVRRPSSC